MRHIYTIRRIRLTARRAVIVIMKDIAIVYSSKCGHTKRYADWLKEDIEADVIALTSFSPSRMASYKLIIFACGVYGDKLSIMDFVKKNITAVPMQKVMVMAVSWYTNDSEEARQKLIADNYPDQFKHNNVPLFVINSGIDKKLISPTDKVKLVAAKAMIDKKDGRTSDDINTLAIIKGYADQTSKDNLASIKKGIDEFFNPPKPVTPPPQPKPAVAAPAPKPADAAPAAAQAAEAVQPPKPQEASKAETKPVSEEDALSNSVEEAFKNLYAPKPKPAAPVTNAPDNSDEEPSAPVARFNENGEIVVSSIVDAIKTLNGEPVSKPKPKPAPVTRVPAPEPEEAAEVKPEPAARAEADDISNAAAQLEPKAVTKPEPVAEVVPEPVTEPEPVAKVVSEPAAETVPEPVHTEPEKPKNSYMELFAKRRRSVAEAASRGETAAPAPVVPVAATAPEPKPESKPEVRPAPAPKAEAAAPAPAAPMVDEFNIADFILEEKPKEYISAPSQSSSYDEDDFGGFEFINEDKPTVSKRAMNAVQDLAKAKEAAELEAAKKAAANEALAAEPNTPAAKNDILEKMRHDIEALAEESEYTQNYDVEEESYTEPEIEVAETADYGPAEEDTDGLEAFAFTDNADYDLDSEFIEPPKLEDMDAAHESKTNFDIRKLQEEINASIETNRAAKEKMMARQSRKQKEAPHNPFAVQFEDDEETKKSKKSKKHQAVSEPKRLADPIDPDIFFSRNNAKNQDFNTGTMPEIKFKNQR